jgi:hypothetical protein
VVEQQPDLERALVEVGRGQGLDALLERRPRDRAGVDRVRLAALARALAGAGHVLGRDPHDPLAVGDQEALEGARHPAAVLDRPHALGPERPRPREQLVKALPAGLRRVLGERPRGGGLDRPAGVRGLVRVRPDYDHLRHPFSWGSTDSGSSANRPHSGAVPRSYQVTPAVLGRRRATQRFPVRPSGRQAGYGSARCQPETNRSSRTRSPTLRADDDSEAG